VSAPVRTVADLEYRSLDGAGLLLDILRPADDSVVPCVAYFHGGGWALGSRKDRAADRLATVARLGLAVCSVSYRLSGVATYPAQLEDARAAVAWLRANGHEHGLRTDRLGAWGASAGGWIALMLTLTGERPVERTEAACAWFPPTELGSVTLERKATGLPLPPFMEGRELPDMEARMLGLASVTDDPVLAREASPLTHAANANGPILLVHGDGDGLINVGQSLRLRQALLAAGRQAEMLVLPGANHEDEQFDRPAVLGATACFLRAALSAR
jgi:acetyl esterase/lipase